jgi:DNA-binding NarL/FixJ family response regulator
MIKLIIADDQDVVRQGLTALLSYQSDLQVIAQAADGSAVCQLVQQMKPDVVLMDIRMPICDGIEATTRIHKESPNVKVLVLTTFDEEELVSQALQAGASGYVLKDTPSDQIAMAIRTVHDGNTFLGAAAATRLRQQLGPVRTIPAKSKLENVLTNRETEVLKLIGRGKNNQEIAELLHITEGTVKNHVTRIFAQVGARDRIHAAMIAQQELP